MDKRRANDTPLDLEVSFTEFLDLTKVIKMLYGRDIAEKFFTKVIDQWYNLDIARVLNNRKGSKQ